MPPQNPDPYNRLPQQPEPQLPPIPPAPQATPGAQPPLPQPQQLNPNEWFQSTNAPYTASNGTYVSHGSGPIFVAPKKTGRKLLALLLIIVAIGLLSGGGVYAYIQSKPTPDKVFAAAVDNSLSTSHVSQVTDAGESGSMKLNYDLSRSDDPRIYVDTNVKIFDTGYKLQEYGTLKDSFVKYEEYAALFAVDQELMQYKNVWMQSRQNGVLANKADSTIALLLTEPYTQLFGDWIFGNFKADDKAALRKIIIDDKTYEYDAAKVTKQKLDGRDVYVYDVTVPDKQWQALNKKTAEIWGVDYDELSGRISMDDNGKDAKLFIDISDKRIVRVESEPSDVSPQKITLKYSGYDESAIPDRPTPKADYKQFTTAIAKAEQAAFDQQYGQATLGQ